MNKLYFLILMLISGSTWASSFVDDISNYFSLQSETIENAKIVSSFIDKNLTIIQVTKNKVKRDFLITQMIQKTMTYKNAIPKVFKPYIDEQVVFLNKIRSPKITVQERFWYCTQLRYRLDEFNNYLSYL